MYGCWGFVLFRPLATKKPLPQGSFQLISHDSIRLSLL